MNEDPADALNEHFYGQGEAPKADRTVQMRLDTVNFDIAELKERLSDLRIIRDKLTEELNFPSSRTKAVATPEEPDLTEDMPEATETVAESARRIFNP